MSKYNLEHYPDPTAHRAVSRIMREISHIGFRRMVFICSPYKGDMVRNAERARGYCRFAISQNCIPVAPHLLFPQFMDEYDDEQRNLGIFFGLVLQSKCKEVWVFGSKITPGIAVEIEKAKKRLLPIRYFTDRCVEVRK